MRELWSLILLGAMVLTPGWVRASGHGTWQWINGARLQSMLKDGSSLWLIDLRNPRSFAAGHIEGAVNMPEEMLAARKLPQNGLLVLADDSLGQRTAKEVAGSLAAKGYNRVHLLEGGIARWKLDGYPYAETHPEARGVTAAELKWANESDVALSIYDLREGAERVKDAIPKAVVVPGKNRDERIESLKKIVDTGIGMGSLDKFKKRDPIVLVFSAQDDRDSMLRLLQSMPEFDVRYLIGGHEAYEGVGKKYVRTLDACPTCSEKR